jgi:hypothetical protein
MTCTKVIVVCTKREVMYIFVLINLVYLISTKVSILSMCIRLDPSNARS